MTTWSIARKEWREAVRDRRSLFSGLFYGVWGPLVMGLALVATARHQGELGPITIGGYGMSQAPSLTAYLESKQVTIAAVDDADRAVRARQLQAAIVVDANYAEHFSASRPAEIALLFDSSRPESGRYAAHLRGVLADYGRVVGDTRLIVRGIAPAAIAPMRIHERDFATTADRAGRTIAMLPIFVLLAAFVGGMSVAADVSAGERERGSLESLLLHPVSRGSIVAGKWLAVSAAALATVALALLWSYGVVRHPRLQQLDLPVGLMPSEAVAMLAIIAPLALATAAVQLLIAFNARTYKEAQTKLSMLIFLPMFPGFLIAFGTLEPAAWMSMVPMLGHHMLITEIVRGTSPGAGAVAPLTVVTLIVAGAACVLAARQLDREAIWRRTA